MSKFGDAAKKVGNWYKDGFIALGKGTKWLLWDHFAKHVLWNKPATPVPTTGVSKPKRKGMLAALTVAGAVATVSSIGGKISTSVARRNAEQARMEAKVNAEANLASMQEAYGYALAIPENDPLWDIPVELDSYNALGRNPKAAAEYEQFLRGLGPWFEKLGVGTGREESFEYTPDKDPQKFLDSFNAALAEHNDWMLTNASNGRKEYKQYLIWEKQCHLLGRIRDDTMKKRTSFQRYSVARQMAENIVVCVDMVNGISKGKKLVQVQGQQASHE